MQTIFRYRIPFYPMVKAKHTDNAGLFRSKYFSKCSFVKKGCTFYSYLSGSRKLYLL